MINLILRRALLTTTFIAVFTAGMQAQNKSRSLYSNTAVYTGIEVGSKGVKMSVIEIGKDAQSSGAFNIVKDTSINTDFISFTPATFTATLHSFTELYNTALKDYKIPARRIFTVISSGVKIQADKDNKIDWINQLIDSFRILTNEPGRKVEVIDVLMEAKLSHLGIVPPSRRYTTFLLDIGSGNTKGGFFPYDNTNYFRLFQLSWGTKSTSNAAEKRCDGDNSLSNYSRQLNRVLGGIESSEIIYAVNASGAYSLSDNIAFSGGIAWAAATLSHPELSSNPVVTVTYEDIRKLEQKLTENMNALTPEFLASNLNRSEEKDAFLAEAKRVYKVFDQKALLAGTGLLLRIMRQFESVYSTKNFYLVKNGQVGWVSAYVDETISK
jgi:hypothetical protein